MKEAIEVVVTKDDHYAFVANENDGTVGVINLQRFYQHDFGADTFIGQIQVNKGPLNEDSGPVGMAISPDNHYLYVTSRIDTGDVSPQGAPCYKLYGGVPDGTLSVIDIARAEQTPAQAVIAHVFAGCGPVRVVLSSLGDVAWVTAQGSNLVLAFSTSRLLTNPGHSLLASVPVEKAPTGMVLVENGAELVVTNSNRNSLTGNPLAPSTITILDTKNMLAGHVSLLGTLQVGAFPRELTLEADGQTLLLTNYLSNTLNIITVKMLPKPSNA